MVKKFITSLLCCTLLLSCSDSVTDLGEGYSLRVEGKSHKEIFHRKGDQFGIPPSIIKYVVNEQFILAIQKPEEVEQAIYDETIEYSEGRDNQYYWIIDKMHHSRIGPLNAVEFSDASKQNGVSSVLVDSLLFEE